LIIDYFEVAARSGTVDECHCRMIAVRLRWFGVSCRLNDCVWLGERRGKPRPIHESLPVVKQAVSFFLVLFFFP
jgi:hypothetical protein